MVSAYCALFIRWFPTERGKLGHDYAVVMPELLDGYFWYRANGLFTPPWFTPSFCGGVPALPDPQNIFYSLPQMLTLVVDPLSAVQLTVAVFAALGFAGFYLLLRRSFDVAPEIALLGATLFLFNGFYAHRMIIGHFPYHAFMLLPLVASVLLRSATRHHALLDWQRGADITMAALLIAYAVHSGMIALLPPFCVALVVVALIAGMARPRHADPLRFVVSLGVSVLIAIGLSATKLAASIAFTSQFPRDLYPLPGFPAIAVLLRVIGESLFWAPADALARRNLVDMLWVLGRHEFELGVTLIPALLIVVATPVLVGRAVSSLRTRQGWQTLVYLGVAVVLLLFPIALNVHTPAWNALLKQVPILKSSSTLIRWLAIYIPVVIVLAALAFEHTAWLRRRRVVIVAAAITLVVAQNALADRAHYDAQPYDPTSVQEGYARTRAGMWSPAITEMMAYVNASGQGTMPLHRNDTLARGQSQILCYQPIFGYTLETFPLGSLRPGPALAEQGGTFNVKNPACYVFPSENHCVPGDHFAVADRADAERFLRYQPFHFALSARQRVANLLNLATLIGVALFLAAYVSRAGRDVTRRRPRT